MEVFDQSKISTVISMGLDALRNESQIQMIPWLRNPYILELAIEFRKIHSDFFDCIIFASALLEAEGIATYDETFFLKIQHTEGIKEKCLKLNPSF